MDIKLMPISKADAKLLYEAWGYNRDNFRYLSAKSQESIEDAVEYINGIVSNPDSLCFHICDRKSGKILGIIKANVEGHRALVGYVVDQAYWSNGVATQALKTLLAVIEGTPKIQRVWATCAIDNPASFKVLEKCGFVREALLKKWIIYPSQGAEPHDNYSYYYQKNA